MSKHQFQKSSVGWGAAVVAGAFFAAGGALAGPNCEEILNNNGYVCQLKASFGDEEDPEAFFQFNSNGDFTLFVDGLGFPLTCSCKTKGSFKNPKFDASKDFHCVGGGEGFALSLAGKVSGSGKKIKKGEIANSDGDTLVFECEEAEG